MKTKIYTNKSNRIYRNGQLVQGLDVESRFNNFKKPNMTIKIYNPLNNKQKVLTNKDIYSFLSKPKSSKSIADNIKSLYTKSRSKTKKKKKRKTKKRRK